MDKDVISILLDWGPALLILAGFYVIINRMLNVLPDMFKAHTQQISKQTEVLSQLKETLRESDSRNNMEHREILLTLHYIAQKLEEISEKNCNRET